MKQRTIIKQKQKTAKSERERLSSTVDSGVGVVRRYALDSCGYVHRSDRYLGKEVTLAREACRWSSHTSRTKDEMVLARTERSHITSHQIRGDRKITVSRGWARRGRVTSDPADSDRTVVWFRK